MRNVVYTLSIFILLLISSCGQREDIKNGDLNTITVQHFDVVKNAMVTKLAVCADEKSLYYADNGKILKKIDTDDSEHILDTCEDKELIQDIFVDDKYIYYSKQDAENVDIISIEKKDLTNVRILQSIPIKSNTFGEDFIYSVGSNIYYYNYENGTLYLFDDSKLQKCIEDVICAFVDKSNVYYVDSNNVIYKCDVQLSNSQKIWSLDYINQIDDEYFVDWCTSNINKYSIIKNIVVYGNDILFSIHAGNTAKYGLLCSIKSDSGEFNFYKNCVVKGYQLSDDNIYAFGSYLVDGESVKGLFKILPNEQFVSMNINPKEMYISEQYCYFIDDQSGYSTLYRMDLLSQTIDNICK